MMKKGRIILTAFMMGLALIGLMAMQVYWIQHDLKVKHDRFGQQVVDAMNKAAAQLSTRESVQLITRELPSVLKDSVAEYFDDFPELPEVEDASSVSSIDSFSNAESFAIVTKAKKGNNQVRIISKGNGLTEKMIVAINTTEDVDSEANVKDRQFSELEAERKMMENESWRKHNEARLEANAALADQAKVHNQIRKINTVLKKMSVEYERKNFNLLDRLNPLVVDSLVGRELKNSGINLPYSISLYSGKEHSTVWKRDGLIENGNFSNQYKTNLFPDDIVNRNNFLQVGFADTLGYFLSSLWLMLLSSAIFSLIIIFAFAYTLHVIFRQKKLSEIKNDFINNMTHEFKTPIATIRLASESITNPEVLNDPEKIKYYSSIIKDENIRMNNHVETILQMAQFDKNAFAPAPQAINIHEVISEAINNIQLLIQEKGGNITFSPDAEKFVLLADPNYIPVVLNNLLDNAVKYCSVKPEIKIETSSNAKTLKIVVTDNGIGMDAATQKMIFEKFYRLSTGNLHNVKGFGLGLSYVKAIVTAHSGTISVISEPGNGSTFIIELPFIN